jgi:hypothetical protein
MLEIASWTATEPNGSGVKAGHYPHEQWALPGGSKMATLISLFNHKSGVSNN